jgi:hypothetical protein
LRAFRQVCQQPRLQVRNDGHHQRSKGDQDFGIVLLEASKHPRSVQGLGSEKKKQKHTLVDLAAAIIDPYYRDMKAECDKDKFVWHKAWVNELNEEHIKYVAKDAHQIQDVQDDR